MALPTQQIGAQTSENQVRLGYLLPRSEDSASTSVALPEAQSHQYLPSVEPYSQVSPAEPFRRPNRLSHISDPDVSTGNDPPTGTLIQRCGETGQRGPDIRVLCPPRARSFYGEATPDADSSDLSARLVNLHQDDASMRTS